MSLGQDFLVPVDWDDFVPMYDAHERRVYRLALLLHGGDRGATEDAVAETFVRSYRAWSAGDVNDVADVGVFARRTLVGLALDRPPRRPRRRAGGTDDGTLSFAALARLPAPQRTAVVLRFYEDLPYETIAATMDVDVVAAKALVTDALQQIRSTGRRRQHTDGT